VSVGPWKVRYYFLFYFFFTLTTFICELVSLEWRVTGGWYTSSVHSAPSLTPISRQQGLFYSCIGQCGAPCSLRARHVLLLDMWFSISIERRRRVIHCRITTSSEISRLAPKSVRLALNGTNPELFSVRFQYILASVLKKSRANLTFLNVLDFH